MKPDYSQADYNMLCAAESFATEAAELGWDKAAFAVEAHLQGPPEGDEWTEDYAAALRGISEAFLRAESIKREWWAKRKPK